MEGIYPYRYNGTTYLTSAAAFAAWEADGYPSGDDGATPTFIRAGKPSDAQLGEILAAEGCDHNGPYGAGLMMGAFRLRSAPPTTYSIRECAQWNSGIEHGRKLPKVPRSHNMEWGFWGTWRSTFECPDRTDPLPPPSVAWAHAMWFRMELWKNTPAFARERMDSSDGRHLADALIDRLMSNADTAWGTVMWGCMAGIGKAA